MKFRFAALTLAGTGVLVAAGASVALVAAETDRSVNVPVEALQFYKNKDGLTFANGWGDPATGPHSNYIKMPGNTGSPPHIHSSSYYGVVISGVVSNERLGDPDRPLAPGSYWYQKGRETHITKCISDAECLIFVTSKGPFDFKVSH